MCAVGLIETEARMGMWPRLATSQAPSPLSAGTSGTSGLVVLLALVGLVGIVELVGMVELVGGTPYLSADQPDQAMNSIDSFSIFLV